MDGSQEQREDEVGVARVDVTTYDAGEWVTREDAIACEAPLELKLSHVHRGVRLTRNVALTMRTPGDDEDLARGLMWTERIIEARADIASVELIPGQGTRTDAVIAHLRDGARPDLRGLDRPMYMNSSCGICGKRSLGSLGCRRLEADFVISPTFLLEMEAALRDAQRVFERTGGLHAAGLFDPESGSLLTLREDIGRHNAVDKVLGARPGQVLMVSGRVGYEIVQKCVVASVPVLAAVGAPSSLSVRIAQRHGLTLAGFVRRGRFNIYAGRERVEESP